MKKKILIVMPYLLCGGVEKSLFSFLESLDRDLFSIELKLVEMRGDLLAQVPDWVSVSQIQLPVLLQGVFEGRKRVVVRNLKNKKVLCALNQLVRGDRFLLTEDREANLAYFETISDRIPACTGEYDVAIDYFGYVSFTTFYVAEKVTAKVKLSWMHSILGQLNPIPFTKYYQKFDRLFAVSESVKADILDVIPQLEGKVEVFYNLIHSQKIHQLADLESGFDDAFDGLRILTVARLSPEKGIDLAIEVMARLKEKQLPVKWYVVGDGAERDTLQRQIADCGLKDDFFLLGMKSNPYPFMKQCNLYVQPSRFEGYCTTTIEAKIFCRPVVATDVSGMREQFEDGVTGLICPTNADGIERSLEALIGSPALRDKLASNLSYCDFSFEKELQKFYQFLKIKRGS